MLWVALAVAAAGIGVAAQIEGGWVPALPFYFWAALHFFLASIGLARMLREAQLGPREA